MARVQPVLAPTELALVYQMAELTHSKRTDVIKNALGVYHWFVRQASTGGRASDSIEAARIKERLTRLLRHLRTAVAKIRRHDLPPALFQPLLDRIQSRRNPATQLEQLATWLDAEPEVPEGAWYKRFSGANLCRLRRVLEFADSAII